jgi:hypothetical protein
MSKLKAIGCFCCVFLLAILNAKNGLSQSTSNYLFTTNATGSLLADRNGNAVDFSNSPNLINNSSVSGVTTLQPIGFDFFFMGRYYTHFVGTADGDIGLAVSTSPNNIISAVFDNNFLIVSPTYPPSTASCPIIAPFWDDLRASRQGNTLRTTVTGTLPNRCLVVEWNENIQGQSSTNSTVADGTYQLRLYETTGEIEYVYGRMYIGPNSATVTASIGFTNGNTDNKFIGVTDLSTFATTTLAGNGSSTQTLVGASFNGPIFNLNSTTDGNRRRIRFTPSTPAGSFSSLSFSNVTPVGMTLNWTDNFSNETAFVIYRSLDNINFSYFGTVNANVTSFPVNSLNYSTAYYWKVFALREGSLSTPIAATQSTTACSVSGTLKIGPNAGDDYTSITNALNSIKIFGLGGNTILELQNGYSSSSETYPLVFPFIPCQDAHTLTVRPASGTTGLTISSATSPVISLDGIQNLIIDGRPGSAGTAKELTITSTAANASVIQFNNDASYNILEYLNLKSVPTAITNGIVVFNTTNGTTGNDNNKISFCDIGHPTTASTNGIYADGTAGMMNDNNEISNNNFFNFFSLAVNSSGISVTENNSGYTISNNSFYQTSGTASSGARVFVAAIRINTTSGGGFIINGNSIGGSAAGCGGAAYISTAAVTFMGIYTNTSPYILSSITNNTIANLSLALTHYLCTPTGIFIAGGKINCSGNIIGSQLVTNNITVSSASNDVNGVPDFAGFDVTTTDSVTLSSNVIGGIAGSGTGKLIIYGTRLKTITSSGCYTLNDNTIGNPSLAGSITNNATIYSVIHGINSTSYFQNLSALVYSGNTIANISSSGAGVSSQVAGIYASEGKHALSNNTIHDLSGSSPSAGSNTASVIGISNTSGVGTQAVSGNTIYALTNTNPSANAAVIGINVCNSSLATPLPVAGNIVHGLSATGSGNVTVTGIYSGCGNTSIYNNMIRLGIDGNGNSTSGNYEIRGIYQGAGLTAMQKISFNSVYIGGSFNSTQNTYAFYNVDSTITKKIFNNIFVNARINNSGNGKNYAIQLGGKRRKQQGLTMSGNLYYAPGAGGNMGSFNGTIYNDFSAWRDATGVDSSSGKGDPSFINPTGNSSTFNLHLNAITPAEGAGVSDTLILQDIDNDTRANNTPVDIGADAGNFTAVDVIAPSISYSGLNNATSLVNHSLLARIADITSGVYTSGNLQPRIWYRRSFPATTSWTSVQGTLVSGNANDGTWNFTIDYSLIGVTPAVNDVYEYYFTAQDIVANLSISPGIASQHTDVNTQIVAPSDPLSYRIQEIIPAIVNVGVGERFTSLTRTGGLFEFLKGNVMKNDVTAKITTDITEDGTFTLDADSTNDYRLTIAPASASVKAISNTSDLRVPLITINDMSNIVVDGSYNGSGRYLRFINTNSAHPDSCRPVFLLDYGSNNIIISNSIIEGNNWDLNARTATIYLGDNGSNRNIQLRNNRIAEATGSPGTQGLPFISILSTNNANKKITIAGNEIPNFGWKGIRFYRMGDSCIIDSNHFYFNSTLVPANDLSCIDIDFQATGRAHIISNNYFGGSTVYCGGAPWVKNNAYPGNQDEFIPIKIFATIVHDPGPPIYIFNNVIQNISLTYNEALFYGMWIIAKVVLQNNIIGHPTIPNSILNAASDAFEGTTIGLGVQSADSVYITGNIIANMTGTGTGGTSGVGGLSVYGGYASLKNNKIYNLTNHGSSPSLLEASTGVTGMSIGSSFGLGADIDNNEIYNLKAKSTGKFAVTHGIYVNGASDYGPGRAITRNRIYNLENASDSGSITGINISTGGYRLENNQVSIVNGSNTNRITITGIAQGGADTCSFFYNSVYIGGSTNTSNRNSYACRINPRYVKKFQNNLLYNDRTGGTGNHYAIWSNSASTWYPGAANYNFYVANDSEKLNSWVNTPVSMIGWRNNSLGDSTSFGALAANVPSNLFFQSVAAGNLNINASDPHCWYVNGKGLPVAFISGDYDSAANVRSTSIVNGATDIGSDEFNTATLPDTLIVLGRHILGGIDSLVLNGRVVAAITWGDTGTLPTLGSARYYSGTWPNDMTNGASVSNASAMNAWLDIPVTGGSGYTYSITLFYDSSMLGRVQDPSQIVLHKKVQGEDGTWQILLPTQVNTSARTATVSGLTSFSEFTGAQSNATLAVPGSSICPDGTTTYKTTIKGAGYSYQWQADAGNGFADIINDAIYTGVTDSVLTITAPSSAFNRYQYRCVVNTGSGTINSETFLLKITSTWTGATNTDWTNPQNWSCGQLPDANTDIHIKSGLTNYPILTSDVVCRSIIASKGSIINVSPGVTIRVTGN